MLKSIRPDRWFFTNEMDRLTMVDFHWKPAFHFNGCLSKTRSQSITQFILPSVGSTLYDYIHINYISNCNVTLLHPWGQGDKTHYQLVQGCNNVIIVRKIITTIITMIFLTIMIFLLQTDGGGRGQLPGGEWERKHVGDWSEDYLLRWTQWYLSTFLFLLLLLLPEREYEYMITG